MDIEIISKNFEYNKTFIEKISLIKEIYEEKVQILKNTGIQMYNSLFTSIFITFGTFFNYEFRERLNDQLEDIFHKYNIHLPEKRLKYKLKKEITYSLIKDSIPQLSDYYELFNMFYRNIHSVYIVDPQLIFKGWIKEHYGPKEVEVYSVNNLDNYLCLIYRKPRKLRSEGRLSSCNLCS